MIYIIVINLFVLLMLSAALWVVSVIRRDSSIVDPCWGIGFVIVAWVTCWQASATVDRSQLLLVLVSLWGLRLSGYLTWRNHGKGEDYRYVAMRDYHGDRFWIVSLFSIFWLQAVILWFVSLPVQVVIGQATEIPLNGLDLAGVSIWFLGMVFETAGDLQLARFKANPENSGKVMDRGLWRFTRHPNYFGDFCVWWGIYLIALSAGAGWTVASPAFMSFLLLRVSGVQLLEQTIAERRPGYREYIKRTNAFFPGPQRRES